ncbi:MAG: ribonuclease HII [Candidatus Diapherotrites archaeon]|nr:ribonuclease HII [Candidatus Diapherotrites archaeon]
MLFGGIDEAGRGPALGPMVLAVAVAEKQHEERLIELGVKDSKLLSPQERERQYKEIVKIVPAYASVHIHAPEMDALMDRHSLNEIEAMKIGGLLNALNQKPEVVWVDSPDPVQHFFSTRISKYISFSCTIKSEHKADINHPIVSAASIIAKVQRDEEIQKLANTYGEMGSGYSHDPLTIAFIQRWLKEHGTLPPFARKQWETSQRLLDERYQTKL